MNRMLSIVMIPVMAAVLALAGLGAVYAQGSSSANLQVRGVISTINTTAAPAPAVGIMPEEGSPIMVNVVANTVITMVGTGTISLSGLTLGDRVVAVYDRTTMNVITITVKSPRDEHEAVAGTIKSIGPSSFVLGTKHEGDVTVMVDSKTLYSVRSVDNATLADLKLGDTVAVMAI